MCNCRFQNKINLSDPAKTIKNIACVTPLTPADALVLNDCFIAFLDDADDKEDMRKSIEDLFEAAVAFDMHDAIRPVLCLLDAESYFPLRRFVVNELWIDEEDSPSHKEALLAKLHEDSFYNWLSVVKVGWEIVHVPAPRPTYDWKKSEHENILSVAARLASSSKEYVPTSLMNAHEIIFAMKNVEPSFSDDGTSFVVEDKTFDALDANAYEPLWDASEFIEFIVVDNEEAADGDKTAAETENEGTEDHSQTVSFSFYNFLPITNENASDKDLQMYTALRDGTVSVEEAIYILERAADNLNRNEGLWHFVKIDGLTMSYIKLDEPARKSSRARIQRILKLAKVSQQVSQISQS